MTFDPAKLIASHLVGPRWVIGLHAASFALLAIATIIEPVVGLLMSAAMLLVRKDWR